MPGIVVWTSKRTERLRRLAAQGLSARALAKHLSPSYHRLSAEAVRKAAERAGISLLARGGAPRGNCNWRGKKQIR
jgi:hypothetical protein